jgi:hypothetical protein
MIFSCFTVSVFSQEAPKSGYVTDQKSGCKFFSSDTSRIIFSWSGQCKDGYAEGEGILVLRKQNITFSMEGNFSEGKINGLGKFKSSDGITYVGEYLNGFPVLGTVTFADGARYVGEHKDGKPDGQGKWIFPDGGTYTGESKNGKPNGNGTYTHANGNKYVGEFKDGKKHGQGTFTWADGKKYVGEFKDDKMHGHGTYTLARGHGYTGQWLDGKPHGKGRETYADGRSPNEGIFEDGRFVRAEKLNLPNPNIAANTDREPKQIVEERRRLEKEEQPVNPNNLPPCPRDKNSPYHNCWGTHTFPNGDKYVGEFKDDRYHGQGSYTHAKNSKYENYVGIWADGKFIREAKVNLPNLNNNVAANTDRVDIERERQQLAEERKRLEEEKRQREQQRRSQRLSLAVSNTQPAADGSFTINVQTNADTASLKINGNEEGGSQDGRYAIRLVARAGQPTTFNITATDIYGNTDTKTITVSRQVVESKATFAALNPANIKKQVDRDAVAVVIGIADYRSLPKAEFANDDARVFYDYAIRALGIKPENIKLLVDGDAEEAEILKTFRTWLPSRVKSTTEVFVFYSGHGLPMPDGRGLYLVPPRADREVIDDTAIPFSKINAALTLSKPKSVTIFLDACYSGQARSGETLVASARPVQLKSESKYFPENFTVITASQNDQISSSNPELQHGVFSYYLMKGMEGDADENRDGKITLGEMQSYLSENVSRHAAMMSRKQEPQLIGDVNRVLVGR